MLKFLYFKFFKGYDFTSQKSTNLGASIIPPPIPTHKRLLPVITLFKGLPCLYS